MAKTYTYSDINLSLLKHPTTEDIVRRYDLEAIRASLKHILFTNKGEKLFNPDFGSGLQHLLFELMTPTTKALAKRRITEDIERWEPRVKIEDVQVQTSNQRQEILVTVYYSLRENEEVTDVITINLDRLR